MSAMALQRSELRQFASPFDWIISSPEMLSHIFQDNYKSFLDSKQYLNFGKESNPEPMIGHQLYSTLVKKGKSTTKIFLHRNPMTLEGKEYYERCVNRIRDVSKSKSATSLLVLVQSSKHRSKHHAWVTQFHRLFATLQEIWQGRFELLIIRLQKKKKDKKMKTEDNVVGEGKSKSKSDQEQSTTISTNDTEMELIKSTDGKESLLRVVYLTKHESAEMEDPKNLDRLIHVIQKNRTFTIEHNNNNNNNNKETTEELKKRLKRKKPKKIYAPLQKTVKATATATASNRSGVADMTVILREKKYIEHGLEELGYDLKNGIIVGDNEYDQHVKDLELKFYQINQINHISQSSRQFFQGVGHKLNDAPNQAEKEKINDTKAIEQKLKQQRQKIQKIQNKRKIDVEKEKQSGTKQMQQMHQMQQRVEAMKLRTAKATKEYEQRKVEQAQIDAAKAIFLARKVETETRIRAAKIEKQKLVEQQAKDANIKDMHAIRKLNKLKYKERIVETKESNISKHWKLVALIAVAAIALKTAQSYLYRST